LNKLTPKQQRFVSEYLIDLNATQAAIRAGYSERTAKQMGTENLAKPVLAAAIQKAIAERAARTEVNADYVLNSIVETMERCKQAEPVKYQNGDQVYVDTPDGKMAPAYKFDSGAVLRGAELLGRHLAMFTDKHALGGADDLPAIRQDVRERADKFVRDIEALADKAETRH